MSPPTNPFAALSLIVAPAVLTNASSVLVMSTSNRLARAVDRARELTAQLERDGGLADPRAGQRLRELTASEQRALMLMKALRCFYTALGGFSTTALLSLMGSILVDNLPRGWGLTLELVAMLAGLLAVSSLVFGNAILLQETRIAVSIIQERVKLLRADYEQRGTGATSAPETPATAGD